MADARSAAGGTPEPGTNGSGTQPGGNGKEGASGAEGETPKSFDEWLNSQESSTQDLVETHTAGLRNSLQSERDARKTLEKDLKKLSRGAEQGSELQKKLDELGGNLREQSSKADFYEEAHKRGVSNLKLAFHTAKMEGLMDDRGRVDFEDLKKQFPELFASTQRAAPPPGNAGNGTREGPPKQVLSGNAAVNAAIRAAAGRI